MARWVSSKYPPHFLQDGSNLVCSRVVLLLSNISLIFRLIKDFISTRRAHLHDSRTQNLICWKSIIGKTTTKLCYSTVNFPLTSRDGKVFCVTGLFEQNPSVTDGFPSQRANNTELWCSLWCLRERTIEQKSIWFETPWRCDVVQKHIILTTIIP